MRLNIHLAATAALTLLGACDAAHDPLCSASAVVSTLPSQLDEASGIAISQAWPGVLWVHNDSEGTPLLYALDADGALTTEIDVADVATQSDWEDIAVGPCPTGSCIYIGDIGDNLHDRQDRAILRFAEPDPAGTVTGPAERFPISYPDGSRDAEAMFVTPAGDVYIISKGRSGPVTVYRYPPPLRADERVTLQTVQQLSDGLMQLPDLVTGASAVPDGGIVAVRTYSALRFYRFAGDTLARTGADTGLIALGEPQGEGVAAGADGRIYLVSETGPNREPPPFSRLECRLPDGAGPAGTDDAL